MRVRYYAVTTYGRTRLLDVHNDEEAVKAAKKDYGIHKLKAVIREVSTTVYEAV